MPRVKKVTTDEKPKKQYNGTSPLDFIKFLTSNKTKWEDLPDDVKKTISDIYNQLMVINEL
jgi:hypothetical protein